MLLLVLTQFSSSAAYSSRTSEHVSLIGLLGCTALASQLTGLGFGVLCRVLRDIVCVSLIVRKLLFSFGKTIVSFDIFGCSGRRGFVVAITGVEKSERD